MTTRLSVVVPVKDVAPWLTEMLDSVLRQDVSDLEVIVVDDDSADATPRIVEAYARADPRVRLLHSASRGGGSARNLGLEAATGRYIVFADGDDLVPDGAYRTVVDELDRTGSDLAIARHLKFSSGATWEPMAKWYDVSQRVTTSLEGLPELIANRACWNRVFRTDFVRRIALHFPDAPRANDIVPVVTALTRADQVDLVPVVGYLYRERPGSSSMSARATRAEGILSYLTQERHVAGMLAVSSDRVRRAHARVVLDADGWVHLDQFLRQGEPERSAPADDAVVTAVRELLTQMPLVEIGTVRPERRVLWGLVHGGHVALARRFALGDAATARQAQLTVELLDSWLEALDCLDKPGALTEYEALAREGLLTVLAIRADGAEASVIERRIRAIARVARRTDAAGSEVLSALIDAIGDGDVKRIQFVSAARRLGPLVVDTAESDAAGLRVSGPWAQTTVPASAIALVLAGDDDEQTVPVVVGTARWSATVPADVVTVGRRRVLLRIDSPASTLDLPVVTARMPLPPIVSPAVLQPLADRRDGWRFLVDRVGSRSSTSPRIVSAILRRLRS